MDAEEISPEAQQEQARLEWDRLLHADDAARLQRIKRGFSFSDSQGNDADRTD